MEDGIEIEKECIEAFEKYMRSVGMNPLSDTIRMGQFWNIWKASWFTCINAPGRRTTTSLVTKTSDCGGCMHVKKLIRIVHIADAVEIICNETGMTIPDCIDRLVGVDGLTTADAKEVKLYHMKRI
ncbi:MAG: hypothetical protein C4K49_10700 [Candidatus Thorarchaeota archaeon]|nr:MAG: hypothetical protein C4K49_10700 [Candidatus Thorarchaeota archaeon]